MSGTELAPAAWGVVAGTAQKTVFAGSVEPLGLDKGDLELRPPSGDAGSPTVHSEIEQPPEAASFSQSTQLLSSK
jgi:hypothetical protein